MVVVVEERAVDSAERSVVQRIRRWYRPSNLLLLAGLICACVFWPSRKNWLPDLTHRPDYFLPVEQIRVTQPPRWVPKDLLQQVLKRGQFPAELPLLDPDLAQKLALEFASHPWVATVQQVRIEGGRSIVVDLVYRRPVAMVQSAGGVYPIDAQGILLPTEDFAPAEVQQYPRIEGVRSLPDTAPGGLWKDELVQSAAALADVLGATWQSMELEAIECPVGQDPSRDASESQAFALRSHGSRILWGSPPGAKVAGELSTEQKLGRLERYLKDFGSFHKPAGPYLIDIRHWREISRKPLAAASRSPAFHRATRMR